MSNNNKSLNYDEKVQFIIVGDTSVGKTSIIKQHFEGNFQSSYLATVGVDFFTRDIEIGKKIIRVKVWDTAGQERFKSLTKNFFRNAQGVILVYDVTSRESFRSLKEWINSIYDQVGDDRIKIIIVGNKIDLKREVLKNEALEFCSDKRVSYFETSAKDGTGIEEAFRNITIQALQDLDIGRDSDIMKGRMTLERENKEKNNDKDNERRCKC